MGAGQVLQNTMKLQLNKTRAEKVGLQNMDINDNTYSRTLLYKKKKEESMSVLNTVSTLA